MRDTEGHDMKQWEGSHGSFRSTDKKEAVAAMDGGTKKKEEIGRGNSLWQSGTVGRGRGTMMAAKLYDVRGGIQRNVGRGKERVRGVYRHGDDLTSGCWSSVLGFALVLAC